MRSSLISNHLKNTQKLASLSELKINPFLWPYLANFYKGNTDYRTLAEVLILPRILGTSITTTFGQGVQQFIAKIFSDENFGSIVSGIDIQFVDAVDGRLKYCQLKSGPTALNKDDVKTVSDHFTAVKNLARQNSLPLQHNDLVLGVIYGEPEEMNSFIKKVGEEYTLYAGKEFWYRFTGDEDFYEDLAIAMAEVADEVDVREVINETIDKLAQEIIQKYPEISKSKKL
jgi:hypothetical protein